MCQQNLFDFESNSWTRLVAVEHTQANIGNLLFTGACVNALYVGLFDNSRDSMIWETRRSNVSKYDNRHET